MKTVYCVGEALLDIIFENGQPVHATPGGSMLNSAVSLGRAGIPVHLISDYANDQAGDLIAGFLMENGVSTTFINRYDNGKTAVALAFLDDDRNAHYSFYKDAPANRFPENLPVVSAGDVVLFGSFYSISDGMHTAIVSFVKQARERGAFILYDPNFRLPHLSDLERLKPWILENIGLSTMVRGSDEDFRLIFGSEDFNQTLQEIRKAGCNMLVYTKNKAGVEAMIGDHKLSRGVPVIDPVSTIGAGDAFNAGLIYALLEQPDIFLPDPSQIISSGISFSTEVCLHYENFISPGFANEIKNGI